MPILEGDPTTPIPQNGKTECGCRFRKAAFPSCLYIALSDVMSLLGVNVVWLTAS